MGNGDEARFAIVPIDLLLDHRLTLIETRVAAAILSFRNKNTNVSWPTREQISARCGYKIGTVSNATKGLVKKGWLRKTKTVFNGSNTYEITVPEPHRSSEVHQINEPHRSSDTEPHRSGDTEPHRSGDTNRPLTDQEQTKEGMEPDKSDSAPPCPHKEIIELYHEHCPDLQRHAIHLWGGQRERDLRARWRMQKKYQSLDWWENFFKNVHASDFLNGRVPGKSWKATLTWMVKRENFVKVLEGTYDNGNFT